MIENADQVRRFLLENPKPIVRTSSVIRNGMVTCISPIPTQCDAELRCNPNTKPHLVELLRTIRTDNDV